MADANLVGRHGDRITRRSVNLHILASEGPVPRSLDYRLCVRILKDHGCVIVDPRIDMRLVMVDHGRDRLRSLPVHQPRHQIDAIAAKVVERSRAVLRWIGKPVQELRWYSDLLRPLVSIMNNNAANLA